MASNKKHKISYCFEKMESASSYSSLTECLPEDLITQILLRIPVKSLLRFRLVCKAWYDFIKTPYFISMHHKFNLATVSQLLMCARHDSLIEEERGFRRRFRITYAFSFCSNDKSARVLSPKLPILGDPDTCYWLAANSCNGIVCYYDTASVFLSNPATREFKRLPPSSFQQETNQIFCRIEVALGFDSTNIYDFKVLSLFWACRENTYLEPSGKGLRVEMFTLSSNTWKQLQWDLDDSPCFPGSRGVFCANSFHFLTYRSKFPSEHIIVCCDIRTERFKTMELPSIGFITKEPPSYGDQVGIFDSLSVLKGFLSAICAFNNYTNLSGKSLEIWVMKDYGVQESWTKLCKIGLPWGDPSPECFWIEDDALLLLRRGASRPFSFNLNTLHGEGVKIDGFVPYSHFVVYKETLVSIM